MPLGGFAPLPLRLGGSSLEGLTPAQHARIATDWLSLRRVQPLAEWTYDKAGSTITIHNYIGQNGNGAAFAPTPSVRGTGIVFWDWPAGNQFTDPYGISAPFSTRHVLLAPNGSAAIKATALTSLTNTGTALAVYTWNTAGTATDASVTVSVW